MMEDEVGPWIKHRDSVISISRSPVSKPIRISVPIHLSLEPFRTGVAALQVEIVRRKREQTRNASRNAKLDYYRKNNSRVRQTPLILQSEPGHSVWVPRSKLSTKTPDQRLLASRTDEQCREKTEIDAGNKAESALKTSQSFTDLTELLELNNVHDRTVLYKRTKDLNRAVNWTPKKPPVLPPLVNKYIRHTPFRDWHRTYPHYETLRKPSSPRTRNPSRMEELNFTLNSRHMSPRV